MNSKINARVYYIRVYYVNLARIEGPACPQAMVSLVGVAQEQVVKVVTGDARVA